MRLLEAFPGLSGVHASSFLVRGSTACEVTSHENERGAKLSLQAGLVQQFQRTRPTQILHAVQSGLPQALVLNSEP